MEVCVELTAVDMVDCGSVGGGRDTELAGACTAADVR